MNNGLPKTLPGLENNMDFNDQGLPGEEVTLAEILQEEGYHTVHIGKWHMGRTNGMAPNDQGFDESLLMHSGMYLPKIIRMWSMPGSSLIQSTNSFGPG